MNKRIINQTEFTGLVAKICRDIVISKWQPDYVAGIIRGGAIPAVMISHYLNIPCKSLSVSLRDGGECIHDGRMAEDAYASPHVNSRAKNILIVDDINDSGATLDWLMTSWERTTPRDDPTWSDIWNNNVRFAVVVDNLSSKCKVKMDYSGLEINKEENNIWIDFPYENWWVK